MPEAHQESLRDTAGTGLPARTWAAKLADPSGGAMRSLRTVYGSDEVIVPERVALLRKTVARYLERFGNTPLRLFRAPGRINLRGMHVDTHGGYLNLMTHQREVVVAVTGVDGAQVTLANIEPRYDEVEFSIEDESRHPAFTDNWSTFIGHPDVQNTVQARRGHWGNYLRGTILRILRSSSRHGVHGLQGVVGSDLPAGAALSSSHALCTAIASATLACNGMSLADAPLILAVRDAEWYAGARSGVSDQGAMILGGLHTLVNMAPAIRDGIGGQEADLDLGSLRRMPFPESLRVLVIDSLTDRSLSGRELAEYTRNRFAYSLALEIARQEMRALGMDARLIQAVEGLPGLSPAVLEPAGGATALYQLLRTIPETVSLSQLRDRYNLPGIDEAYDRYFGIVPKEDRPDEIALRGPLLYGVAESERARLFFDALQSSDFTRAGRLMSIGHDGDRRVSAGGKPFACDIGDEALEGFEKGGTPVELLPGVYGASSPVLDGLVDAALSAGALGASLTGAGIAGSVLALCHAEDVDRIAHAVRGHLATPQYAASSGRQDCPTHAEVDRAVLCNSATGAAGELMM